MSRWSIRRSALAILPIALLAGACTGASPADSAPGPGASTTGSVATAAEATTAGPTADPIAEASARATNEAGANPTPSATPKAFSTATARASAAASSPSAEPPAASLAVEGGDPVVGQLGSFTWGGGGSDSPWLPGSPILVGRDERLSVAIDADIGVEDWTAGRAPAGTTDGSDVVGLGSGGPPITFGAPDPGSWSVQVTVRFAGGLGSATYYWRVTVR
jgi:hypothetical protein